MSWRSLVLSFVLAALTGCWGTVGDGPVGPVGTTRTPPVDCASSAAIAPSDRAPRLTYDQYDRAVSDLLQLELSPSTELPGDPGDNFNRSLVDGLQAAAANVATALAADDAAFARVVGCAPTSAAEEVACASQFVRTFGRRAYRRPLTDEETARYDALFTDRAMLTETGSFREGIALLVEVFVQSPGFLLRVERSTAVADGRIPLSQFEIAQRLAFSLWGSVADEELLDAAAAGTLGSREGVLAQATRLLADPRARALVTQEHRTWLGMESADGAIWSNVRRDARPEFAGVTDDDLRGDVLGTLEHVAFDLDGGLRELLTSPAAMVNARTAPLYGLTDTFTEWTPVMLDATERPGLLTRVGFLASHARSTRSSLIYRGTFVVRHLLCQPIGNPPAGAESTPLPDTAGLVTTRDLVDAMTSSLACSTCHHEVINPAGYALESFDEIGAFRALDNGAAVDTTGVIDVGSESVAYTDAASFGTVLAESEAAQRCYAQRWIEFTYSRPATREDACTASTLGDRLSEDGYSVRDLLADLVTTDAFLNRAAAEAE